MRAFRACASGHVGRMSWSFGTVHGMDELTRDAIRKLERFANVRDRATDREPRKVTLTDDEASALLTYIASLRDDAA